MKEVQHQRPHRSRSGDTQEMLRRRCSTSACISHGAVSLRLQRLPAGSRCAAEDPGPQSRLTTSDRVQTPNYEPVLLSRTSQIITRINSHLIILRRDLLLGAWTLGLLLGWPTAAAGMAHGSCWDGPRLLLQLLAGAPPQGSYRSPAASSSDQSRVLGPPRPSLTLAVLLQMRPC